MASLLQYISRFRFVVLAGFYAVLTVFQPVLAFAAEEEEESGGAGEWILSYSLLFLFIMLLGVMTCRSSKRRDSALSDDELKAEREEQLKKELGRA